MSDAVLSATIKAFDEFSQQFQRYQRELQKTDQAQKETSKSTEQMSKSAGTFLQAIGQVGALYAFQRGLTDVVRTSMEFGSAMSRVQALSGATTAELEAMRRKAIELGASAGIFTASDAAEGMSFLAMAGYEASEVIAAMPGLLAAATAGGTELGRTADIVSNILSGFSLEAAEAGRVADVLTEAFTSSNVNLDMLGLTMKYVAPIARGAGFSLEEMAAAAGLLGNAGIQGEMAGTSLRASILRLVKPPQDAADMLNLLGVTITDVNGKMLPLADILEQISTGMDGYSDVAKTQIAATIAGTEAASTFLALIDAGPETLRQFTRELENSEGAASDIADVMKDNLKGSLIDLTSALESSKIAIGDAFTPAVQDATEVVLFLVQGFNALDEDSKKLIATLVGAAGLSMALGTVALAASALGITLAMVTGPVGIAVIAVTTLATAIAGLTLAQSAHKVKQDEHNQSIVAVGENYQSLVEQMGKTERGTDEYQKVQGQTNDALQELARQMPEVISAWDAEGRAIAVNNDLLREKMQLTRQAMREAAVANAAIAEVSYRSTQTQLNSLVRQREAYAKGGGSPKFGVLFDSPEKQQARTEKKLKEFGDKIESARAAEQRARAEWNRLSAMLNGGWSDAGASPRQAALMPGGSDADAKAEAKAKAKARAKDGSADAAKTWIQSIADALHPYRAAVESVAGAVDTLSVKEQYLVQLMQSGQDTIENSVQLNHVREEQLNGLSKQQGVLANQLKAEQATLLALKAAYEQATDPDAARGLRQEIDSLSRSITQAGQAWWQAEQAKLAMAAQVKAEAERRYQDAYQQAMDLMRHQVNMAQMSTEQQIDYLEKLYRAHEWSTQQRWALEEQLFRLQRQQLGQYLSELDAAYGRQLELIDGQLAARRSEIRRQLDALSSQDAAVSREESSRQHVQRMAKLEEQLRYHQLRTGKEHAQAILDIQEQMAEEERQWQFQQDEWSREDQKQHLREQLEQVEDEARREREEWQRHYREARRIAENGILDVIASLAATEPQWMQTGQQLINALIAGMESGDFSSVQRIVDQVRTGEVERDQGSGSGGGSGGSTSPPQKTPIATLSPADYTLINGTAALAARQLGSILGQTVGWSPQKGITIGGKSVSALKEINGTAYLGIRSTAEMFGREVEYNAQTKAIRIYHQGGPVGETGLAYLEKGEYVIPAKLVDAMRRSTVPPGAGGGLRGDASAIAEAADRIVAAIEKQKGVSIENLLNIAHYQSGDEQDIEILSRELKRQVEIIRRN